MEVPNRIRGEAEEDIVRRIVAACW